MRTIMMTEVGVPTDRMVELLFLGVSTLANCVTAVSIFVLYKQFTLQIQTNEKEDEWRRQNLSLSVSREWNSFTAVYRDRIENTFRNLLGEPEKGFYIKAIDRVLAQQIFHCTEDEKLTKDALRQLKSDITILLNYFEYIGVAYEKKALDQGIIKELFQFAMVTWYDELEGYMEYVKKLRGEHGWAPYQRVVQRWKKR